MSAQSLQQWEVCSSPSSDSAYKPQVSVSGRSPDALLLLTLQQQHLPPQDSCGAGSSRKLRDFLHGALLLIQFVS